MGALGALWPPAVVSRGQTLVTPRCSQPPFMAQFLCRLSWEMKKGCILILLQVTESLQHFSEQHFIFCKVPTKFIVCTAFYHVPLWEKGMMILNPKPILKQIILKFYAVNLLLSSDTTFLLILFFVPYSSAKIKDCEAWLVSLACSWYKWWQIPFWFIFLGQQLGAGSSTQFTWMCILYWASSYCHRIV